MASGIVDQVLFGLLRIVLVLLNVLATVSVKVPMLFFMTARFPQFA